MSLHLRRPGLLGGSIFSHPEKSSAMRELSSNTGSPYSVKGQDGPGWTLLPPLGTVQQHGAIGHLVCNAQFRQRSLRSVRSRLRPVRGGGCSYIRSHRIHGQTTNFWEVGAGSTRLSEDFGALPAASPRDVLGEGCCPPGLPRTHGLLYVPPGSRPWAGGPVLQGYARTSSLPGAVAPAWRPESPSFPGRSSGGH